MQDIPSELKIKPSKRTPLLIAAYCALVATLVNLILGTGMMLILTPAGLSVLLAVGEIVLQMWRRRASS